MNAHMGLIFHSVPTWHSRGMFEDKTDLQNWNRIVEKGRRKRFHDGERSSKRVLISVKSKGVKQDACLHPHCLC